MTDKKESPMDRLAPSGVSSEAFQSGTLTAAEYKRLRETEDPGKHRNRRLYRNTAI